MRSISVTGLPDLVTIREMCTVLRISPLTLKRWGKKGILVPIRINSRGDRRWKKRDLLKYLGMEDL